jgi:hypothetical protein
LLLGQAGFRDIQTRHDIAQYARCTGGCWHPEVASLDACNSR